MPLGELKVSDTIVSAIVDPGANLCTRLLPASMIYLRYYREIIILI
jgi:hypothetical protein